MTDHEGDDEPQGDREGFLGVFIIVTIGTFALLASTLVRSAVSFPTKNRCDVPGARALLTN